MTVAKGDGIGPEIMNATLTILLATGTRIELDEKNHIISILSSAFAHGIDPIKPENLYALAGKPISMGQGQ